jgi:THO complex subunit 4
MSGKLDQSLDQIMKDTKPAGGRVNRSRRGVPARSAKSKAKAAIAAPTGGISKNKSTKPTTTLKSAALSAAASGESKIIVSNLPEDVNEALIKVR